MPANPRVFMDVRIGNENVGRMEFELFADTTPRTAENFRCLCTGEKGTSKLSSKALFYKNSIFHRIIKGFMAQGGDFTNANGTGGESIYGRSFGDESFARKHIGPGMLSMANAGKNTNGSQFFITFKSTPHLNGKHVVFGRLVAGMPVLQKMEGQPTARGDKPLHEIIITNCGEVGKAPPNILLEAAQTALAAANEEEIDIDGDEAGGEKEEEDTEPEKPANYEGMSAREKKLFELKLKLNKARKDNRREAKEEHSRFNSGKKGGGEKREEYLEKKKNWEKEVAERGEDVEDYFMHETAESVNYRDKKKSKKKQASFGWEVFSQDAGYRAYKKRLEEQRKNEDDTSRDVNSLDYFEAHQPSAADVDRMAAELTKTQERRGKYSRRRPHYEEQDIDHINSRNEVFNKKVKRSYDKYTAEIKANLERGTAL